MLEDVQPLNFQSVEYTCKKCGNKSTRSGIIQNFNNICALCRDVAEIINRDDSDLKKTLRLIDLVLGPLPIARTYKFDCVICGERAIEHGILGKSKFMCLSCKEEERHKNGK